MMEAKFPLSDLPTDFSPVLFDGIPSNLFISGMSKFSPNWFRLAPNGTNLGLFKISFSTFWLGEPKCTGN